MNITRFEDYKLLDMSNGEKVENWNGIILRRPDPQVIWNKKSNPDVWKDVHAYYHRSKTGGGAWEYIKKVPESWQVHYKDLTFNLKLMGFKHTGLFPEQAFNWDFIIDKIKKEDRKLNVLNLFAYTGGATVAAAYAGADVVHVDASRGMVDMAQENIKSSNLEDRYVRFIVDDVIKFVEREIRRGHKYDAIIMDPPSFGRGANKEIWKFEENLYDLVELCTKVLSDDPVFFLINSYTTGISSKVLENILNVTVNKEHKGKLSSGEVGLPMENSDLVLPCGIYGRWEKDE